MNKEQLDRIVELRSKFHTEHMLTDRESREFDSLFNEVITEIHGLSTALLRYGKHDVTCEFTALNQFINDKPQTCDCGLENAQTSSSAWLEAHDDLEFRKLCRELIALLGGETEGVCREPWEIVRQALAQHDREVVDDIKQWLRTRADATQAGEKPTNEIA